MTRVLLNITVQSAELGFRHQVAHPTPGASLIALHGFCEREDLRLQAGCLDGLLHR